MSEFNILTGREQNQLIEKDGYFFQADTHQAFLKLQEQLSFKNIKLDIVSSFRDFHRQAHIWNEKAQGKRKLYDRQAKLLNYSELSKKELLHHILTWSAIPGASRHHWGTDLDVFDSRIKKRQEVQLNHQEYLEEFSALTKELSSLMQNHQANGFFRPYALDNNGVAQELWHISYAPKSNELDQKYTLEVFAENIKQSDIELKDLIINNLKSIFEQYVKNTSSN